MRIFKFRMWDDILKIMYTPELDSQIINLWEAPIFKGGVFYPREGIKMMLFTGKYDSKVTPIYEGDIIEFDKEEWGGDDNIHVVSWNDKDAEWCFGGGCTSDMEWRTVIGNIWQHEYLLPINKKQ